MSQTVRKNGLMAGAASIVLASVPAFAQDTGIEEITVTATKMGATNLQETPIAMSAFETTFIDETGVRDLKDLAISTPNLVIAQNGGAAQVYIRGIGSNNSFAGGETSSTVHLDGVYLARPGSVVFNFLDIERVEVLRGPQGTLYGRNSVGGTINIITRKPDNEFHAKAQLTAGNYDLWRQEGYVSGPLVKDKLAISLAGMHSKRDGYFKNVVATGNDRGTEDLWSFRGQLRATPTDRLEVLIRGDYLEDKSIAVSNQVLLTHFYPVPGGPEDPVTAAIFGDNNKFAADTPSSAERHLLGVSGEITFDLSDTMTLKSLTAYRESNGLSSADTDASDQPRLITTLGENQNQLSQEFNLSGRFDRARYVLGFYYFDEHIEAVGNGVQYLALGLRLQPNPVVDTRALAGYGQLDYDLTDKFTVSAGIRYSDEKKDFDQFLDRIVVATDTSAPGFPVIYSREGKYSAWTPKFGLEYKASEDVMLYASVTRGFKSGGFNLSSTNSTHGYGPETLWSYEIGFKTDLADNRIRLNGSAFYYDYKDLQVQAFITPGVTDITNASDAKVKGVELELLARPTDGFDLGGTVSFLDATYDNFPAAPITGGTFDASGKRLNSAPKWSYTAFAQYDVDLGSIGGLSLRGEYGWKARQFFTVVNDNMQTTDPYGLLNASVSYVSPDDRWRIIVYGRNLTDVDYFVSSGSFTAVPSGTPGDPRTWGVRLSLTY